jgi:hypothetical protein
MGLDNGIILKAAEGKTIAKPPVICKDFWACDSLKSSNKIDIAYWRKCWGIRGEILEICSNAAEDGRYYLTVEQLYQVREVIRRFLHRKYYEENEHGYWDWKDIKRHLIRQYFSISWAIRYMRRNSGVECYFYDSY